MNGYSYKTGGLPVLFYYLAQHDFPQYSRDLVLTVRYKYARLY
jgi:hypothetical protein